MITLYHGSTHDINCIDLQKSRPNKDFVEVFIFLPIGSKLGVWLNSKR